MKFKSFFLLSSALMTAACHASLVSNVPTAPASNVVGKGAAEGHKFTYKVLQQTNVEGPPLDGSRDERMDVDGHKSFFAKGEVVVRLKSTDRLDAFLKRHGGKVIDRQYKISLTPTRKLDDGSIEQGTSTVLAENPVYLIDFSDTLSSESSELNIDAQDFGFHGNYQVYGESAARLINKAAKIHASRGADVEAASLNYRYEPTYVGVSTEGYNRTDPTFTLRTAPNDWHHWMVAPNGYYYSPTGVTVNGANIMSGNSSIKSLRDYSTGWDVKVAVIDTGFQGSNESIMPIEVVARQAYYHYDFENNQTSIQGDQGSVYPWHGRDVVSLITAPANDTAGTLGTAPGALPGLFHTGTNYTWRVQNAIYMARNNGFKIINMSFSDANFNDWGVYNEIVAAHNAGIVLIGATGNSGNVNAWPAAWGEVIGIGGHDEYGQRAVWAGSNNQTHYSNEWWADINAPCEDVATAGHPDDPYWGAYHGGSGTSLSAPIVSGVVASTISLHPTWITNTTTARDRLFAKGYSYPVGKSLNAIRTVTEP